MASPLCSVSASSERPKGKGIVEVQPRVTIHSVNEIDVKAQTFEMDLQVELQWKDLGWLERMEQPDWMAAAKELGWQEQMRKTCWHPGLVLRNCKEKRDDAEVWFRVDRKEEVHDAQDRRIYFIARVHAVFRTKYRLHKFPFDMQWLTVRMGSSFEFVRFVRQGVSNQAEKPDFLDRAAFILEEYRPPDYVCVEAKPADKAASSSAIRYQDLNIKVAVQRNHWYYLMNVFLIDFALVGSSLFVLLVPPAQFEDRMGLSLTLLLTAVAFKELVNTYLPQISYSTILDKYVLAGFIMQVLVVVQNAVAKVEAGEHDILAFSDTMGFPLLFAYLVGYHLYFLCEAWRATREDAEYWVRKAGERSFEGQDRKEAYRWHRVHDVPPLEKEEEEEDVDEQQQQQQQQQSNEPRERVERAPVQPQKRGRQLRAANPTRLLRSVSPRFIRPAPNPYVQMPDQG
ncbi:hypothetical protein EMIHUDRAFT_421383 [Emiliania huxleyi CCMP1516]|uniref:Neurotransmitter-gated ion-channel ligand-binding domain-containing protein n=2 Tax=Emiliania huxleyi TaxID=2903 RepID=A0A0D3JQH0_EMIH1|nr:hypothetical protein EMIHUDRAFT_421383 [Emiliania huxleyi CCMP1516]EOD25755.1 hypothetical protein EMIHUDRAFT_421383 [Emiliania huxleyi CCMP1516]|eukprot:XP_005778184.1 hypothetical protein EMIHUDRAFT_421383 [Emiliania huxleyi CCMP1516]